MNDIDPLITKMVSDLLTLTPDELDKMQDDDILPDDAIRWSASPEPTSPDMLKQCGIDPSATYVDRVSLLKILKNI